MDCEMMDSPELWPSGLRVMVVESNSQSLLLVEQLLLQCHYTVISYQQVQDAISFVKENRQSIDLIISDVFLPAKDSLLFFKTDVFDLDIPIVMMSWSWETSLAMNYIALGACDFLIKPIRFEELTNIWQHVFRKEMRSRNEFGSDVGMTTTVSFKKRLGYCAPSMQETDEVVTDVRDLKLARIHWTRQLHHQFVAAVDTLGLDRASPKKILEIMKVRHLTREQVASHLQKHKIYLKKLSSSMPRDVVESSTSHGSEIPHSLEPYINP